MMTMQTEPWPVGRQPLGHRHSDLNESGFASSDAGIPKLVARFYASAPELMRIRLLEHLLKPLEILSLVTVANGIFADMLFRRGFKVLQIRPDDAQNVSLNDVIALVDHVQRVSSETLESLPALLKNDWATADSPDAARLVSALLKRTKVCHLRQNCARSFIAALA